MRSVTRAAWPRDTDCLLIDCSWELVAIPVECVIVGRGEVQPRERLVPEHKRHEVLIAFKHRS